MEQEKVILASDIFFLIKVSCSPCWPQIHYVSEFQANLEFPILLHLPPKFWDYKQTPPCPAILGFIINPTIRHKPAPLVASVSLAKRVSTEALGAHWATAALGRVKKGLALHRHVQVPGQLGVTGSGLVSSTDSSLRKWR